MIASRSLSLRIFDKYGTCNDSTLQRKFVALPDGHARAMRATVYRDNHEPYVNRQGNVSPWCAPWILCGIF